MMRRDNCLRRPAQVDLTHSACRTALCAHRTAGVDVNRTLRIGTADVAFGRKGAFKGAAEELPLPAPKHAFIVAQADRRDGRIPPFNDLLKS